MAENRNSSREERSQIENIIAEIEPSYGMCIFHFLQLFEVMVVLKLVCHIINVAASYSQH